MFETVGLARRPEAGRREVSLLIALTVNFAFVGLLWHIRPSLPAPVEIERVVPVIFREALTPAPEAPKPASAAPRRARAPAPTVTSTPPPEQSPTPVEPAAAVTLPTGDPTADAGPVGEGEGEGEGGEGEGEGSGVRAVHYSEIQVTHRVVPEFPRSARALELDEARCQVHFVVDERGKPEDVTVAGCADAFAQPARVAAFQWRFKPMTVDGRAVKSSFVLNLVFRLR